MITNSLTFELVLDPAETVRATQEIERRDRDADRVRVVVFWLLIPVTMVLVWKGGLLVVGIYVAVLATCALWALVWPVVRRRQIRQLYQGTPTLSGPQRYEFTEDGLFVANAGAENLIRWAAFIEAAETSEFFLLYFAKKCAYYLPKRVVASELREDQVREFLHAKLGERAIHIARPT